MKRLVILNPQSRHGTAGRLFDQMRSKWDACLGDYELYLTKAAGDATDRVRSVVGGKDYDQIIIAGGDGSINEAFRGYWNGDRITRSDIPLGVINLGTGGDFFRTLVGGAGDYEAALVSNRFQRIDAGRAIDATGCVHPFLNIASVGMAGEMLHRLKSSKFQSGAIAYFYHTLRTLAAFGARRAELIMTDVAGREITREVDLLNFFICNGRFSGGGMEWAPKAELGSGSLRLTLIGGKKKLPLVLQSRKIYSGAIESFPGAETFEVKKVVVRSGQAMSMEADGEVIDTGKGRGFEVRFDLIEKVFPLVM